MSHKGFTAAPEQLSGRIGNARRERLRRSTGGLDPSVSTGKARRDHNGYPRHVRKPSQRVALDGGRLVGASNALAAFIKYAGKIPPTSMNVLLYMALVSKDSDAQPWYGQGHAALAQHALGRPGPTTASDLRAVERAVEPLLGDALTVIRKAAVRIDGPNTVRYRLNLTGTAHARRKASGVKASGDQPLPTESDADARRFSESRPTVSGTHSRRKPSDRGDTRRHEELSEEEILGLRTDLTVGAANEESTKGNGFCLVCYELGQFTVAVDEVFGSACRSHLNVVPLRRPA